MDTYSDGKDLKMIKQKLTSLKKMMGIGTSLEPEEKKEKKKAYLRNLEMR